MVKVMSTVNVIIFGRNKNNLSFTLPIRLHFDENECDVERAIIRHFNSQVSNFQELVVQQGWTSADWTYPQSTLENAI